MVQLPVGMRIAATDIAWISVAIAAVAIEHSHPILPHQWMLMCVAWSSYTAHLPGSNNEHLPTLRGWLWAKRYPIVIVQTYLLCALVDLTFVDNGYVVLVLMLFAFMVSLAVTQKARQTI